MYSTKDLKNHKDEFIAANSNSEKTWRALNFPSADAAASWVNIPPAQGPGEVTIEGGGTAVNVLVYL